MQKETKSISTMLDCKITQFSQMLEDFLSILMKLALDLHQKGSSAFVDDSFHLWISNTPDVPPERCACRLLSKSPNTAYRSVDNIHVYITSLLKRSINYISYDVTVREDAILDSYLSKCNAYALSLETATLISKIGYIIR